MISFGLLSPTTFPETGAYNIDNMQLRRETQISIAMRLN